MNINIKIMNFSKEQKKTFKSIANLIMQSKGSEFIGVSGYESKTSGEVANHTILINYSYKNAVKKDLQALNNATVTDINTIAKKGTFKNDLVLFAINKLKTSFEKNLNKETASNQSKGQSEAFFNIASGLKVHIDTGQFYIYGATIQKKVTTKGTYKSVNSRELTLCQNKIKKYFKFKTIKYRSYIINPEQLESVNMQGFKYEF